MNAIDRVRDDFGEAITMIAHNLDFEGYRYLKTYGPTVHVFGSGRIAANWPNRNREVRASDIDAPISQRCVSFVVDAALRLEGNYHGAVSRP